MSNKKLSIIVLFCDKDKQYIPDLLKQIRTKVKIPHEVVLIDNCTDPVEPDGDDFKYYAFGYNAYQLAGRKKGAELASGDYMWFVDADDEILSIEEKDIKYLEENDDIIIFNIISRVPIAPEVEKDFIIEGNLLQESIYRTVVKTLWNKWIRSGIVRKIERAVPKNLETCSLEDTLIWIGALFYGKQIRFATKTVYYVHQERGYTGRDNVETLEAYKMHTKGFLENRNIILKNFLVNMPILAKTLKGTVWYIERLLSTNSKDLLEKCVDVYLNDCIDDPKILTSDFELAYFHLSKRYPVQWDWLVEALQKRFPGNSDFDVERVKAKYTGQQPLEFDPENIRNKIVASKVWSILAMEKSLKRLKDVTFRDCI